MGPILSKFIGYITFSKKEASAKGNTNLRLMHGMNRISILVFTVAVVIMLVKYIKG